MGIFSRKVEGQSNSNFAAQDHSISPSIARKPGRFAKLAQAADRHIGILNQKALSGVPDVQESENLWSSRNQTVISNLEPKPASQPDIYDQIHDVRVRLSEEVKLAKTAQAKREDSEPKPSLFGRLGGWMKDRVQDVKQTIEQVRSEVAKPLTKVVQVVEQVKTEVVKSFARLKQDLDHQNRGSARFELPNLKKSALPIVGLIGATALLLSSDSKAQIPFEEPTLPAQPTVTTLAPQPIEFSLKQFGPLLSLIIQETPTSLTEATNQTFETTTVTPEKPSYTIQPGDNLSAILSSHGKNPSTLEIHKLMKQNPELFPDLGFDVREDGKYSGAQFRQIMDKGGKIFAGSILTIVFDDDENN